MQYAKVLGILKQRKEKSESCHRNCACPDCNDYQSASRRLGIPEDILESIYRGRFMHDWDCLSPRAVAGRARQLVNA